MSRKLALIAVLAIAGCGSGDNDPGPGGVTVGEARSLDEAAEMIEQRRMPPEVLQPSQPAVETAAPDRTAQ
ncbi:MAG: hypothetical protein P8J20_00980 [Novosphingobium sp.]|nr:hypothetical protein [Novosphingobium sp.]